MHMHIDTYIYVYTHTDMHACIYGVRLNLEVLGVVLKSVVVVVPVCRLRWKGGAVENMHIYIYTQTHTCT